MKVIETNLKWAYSLTKRVVTDTLVVHHAAGNGTVEAIHNGHLSKGWAGIGYHYYVRKDGSVYRGRPEWAVGGHTSGHNWHSLGICFEGNFENETMSSAQLEAGRELIVDILSRWGKLSVKRHKDLGNTLCPGKNFPFEEMLKAKEESPMVYEKLGDVPESYRPTIEKLMKKGYLQGTDIGKPDDLSDNILNVDETYCRVMTTLDRMGVI